MVKPHTFPSARSSPAANGAPQGSGYVYRGSKPEPPDPAETSERSRRDAAKRRAGAVLRAAREAAGLSMREAAEVAGVSAGYISAIECGHDWASARVTAALAAAYGVTMEALTAGDGG
jgi:DNA-binding XRE family transcriptional regulator